MTTLYHFSEEAGIERFVPRPVAVPAERPPGMEWLNGPLVWAVDEWHSPMYLFPRECPRILIWRTGSTTAGDDERWFGHTAARMIAYIEWAWFERRGATLVWRYQVPAETFADLDDAGMWVSREPVEPLAVDRLEGLPSALAAADVELRIVPSLVPLGGLWETTVHVSGIRLRNAAGWGRPSLAGGP
ncbi:hypothetical protein J0H33_02025 [bacterium]|nr:hypothetical protein [bacterium]